MYTKHVPLKLNVTTTSEVHVKCFAYTEEKLPYFVREICALVCHLLSFYSCSCVLNNCYSRKTKISSLPSTYESWLLLSLFSWLSSYCAAWERNEGPAAVKRALLFKGRHCISKEQTEIIIKLQAFSHIDSTTWDKNETRSVLSHKYVFHNWWWVINFLPGVG